MATLSKRVLHTRQIKEEARRLGFEFAGVSKSGFLEQEAPRLEEWLRRGYHGKMEYMERNFDKRLDTTKLVPGSKSVITLLYNYYPSTTTTQNPDAPKISKYAWGEDYHIVLKSKLKELMQFIQTHIGKVEGRGFVDSAPVMERAWAAKSGAGWIGKNSLLLHKKAGSYFFLAELIIDLALEYDSPVQDYCGTCTRCIDACPTQAITGNQLVDGSKCISYFTIELKDGLPAGMSGKFENWMFGCDICQDVCPWNRFAQPHAEPRFTPAPMLLSMGKKDWEQLSQDMFSELFRKSAVKRAKYAGLQRNIVFLLKDNEEMAQKSPKNPTL